MDTVELKVVIITMIRRRGKGVKDDPTRVITEIWDLDGNKITEMDPYQKELEVDNA